MFRNYLAAALRNLLRNRLYTPINIAGLGVGFAVAWVIAVFIRDELSYDRFFADSARLYRVYGIGKPPVSGFNESATTESDISGWLPLEFPQVEYVQPEFFRLLSVLRFRGLAPGAGAFARPESMAKA